MENVLKTFAAAFLRRPSKSPQNASTQILLPRCGIRISPADSDARKAAQIVKDLLRDNRSRSPLGAMTRILTN